MVFFMVITTISLILYIRINQNAAKALKGRNVFFPCVGDKSGIFSYIYNVFKRHSIATTGATSLVDKPTTSMTSVFGKRFGLFRNSREKSQTNLDSEFSFNLEPWTPTVFIDTSSPLTIKRNNKRRVTFASIDNDSEISLTQLSSTPKIHEDFDKNTDTTQRLIDNQNDNSSTGSEHESHVNLNFQTDETNSDDYFVSAFGNKGKDIGEFQDAKDITVLSKSRLLITDLVNSRVQICNSNGKAFTLYSGKEIQEPWATAVTKESYIAVTSCKSKCVRILNADGEVIKTFGEQFFSCPTGIAVDNQNQLVVCDSMTNKVSIHEKNGNFIKYVGNSEIKEETFSKPRYVRVSVTGDIIVSDSGNHKIKVFDSNGHFKKAFGGFGKGTKQFKCPYGITTNKLGDIFVADHYNNRITMYTRDGVFIRDLVTAEHGLVHPQGIAISDNLHLYVTHGHLKANEILTFKLNSSVDCHSSDFITHV